MGIITRWEKYTGTLESLEKLVERLQLDFRYDFNFDVLNRSIWVIRDSITYHPGDTYVYLVNEKFEVI
jgi:hypothetical protein